MNPVLSICEQPLQKGYRFRYLCEGSAHGPITGATSTKDKKTFPTIKIEQCLPNTTVYLHVSLCAEDSEEVHMHNLHGKSVFNGEYLEELRPNNRGDVIHSIQGISILHTKIQDKNEILGCKLAQCELLRQQGISQYIGMMTGWTKHHTQFDVSRFKKEIPNLQVFVNHAGSMSAANNVVRLCFRAYVACNGQIVQLREYSNPIYDCKASATAPLKIHRISRISGSMEGGEEVFLICDKIERHDIEVIFYSEQGEKIIGNGTFSGTDVYHQHVIVFKTPQCRSHGQCEVNAKVCIRRKKNPSDQSLPFDFTFTMPPTLYSRQEIPMDTNFETYYHQPTQFLTASGVPNYQLHNITDMPSDINYSSNSSYSQYPHNTPIPFHPSYIPQPDNTPHIPPLQSQDYSSTPSPFYQHDMQRSHQSPYSGPRASNSSHDNMKM
ncbi:Nuclear factor NF-kappa-B [Oopsacas minuta]|uniref:Nuclear factor NF-kappa-B n=1 Tax=Oopsacas minuta TaxID=111878 RepID=A0AAV7JN62_9METZ|nr:Nuclear factor NF-kappa-B [Oopsacas minuta]